MGDLSLRYGELTHWQIGPRQMSKNAEKHQFQMDIFNSKSFISSTNICANQLSFLQHIVPIFV